MLMNQYLTSGIGLIMFFPTETENWRNCCPPLVTPTLFVTPQKSFKPIAFFRYSLVLEMSATMLTTISYQVTLNSFEIGRSRIRSASVQFSPDSKTRYLTHWPCFLPMPPRVISSEFIYTRKYT